ncbi:MAG TPA: hypothetical protein VK550_31955 [Polyangiaceae bacterium]|nr:hypothetical protein [Polyangiaceae bacterium]
MMDISHDFDILAERADDYGALWAARTFRRFLSTRQTLPEHWPGTLGEARRVVSTFATRAGFVDREKLASIVQRAAESTWTTRD